MAKQTTQKANVEQLRVNEKKWTKPLMDAGWSALPNIIIEKQAALCVFRGDPATRTDGIRPPIPI